jgi:hypothetical protein
MSREGDKEKRTITRGRIGMELGRQRCGQDADKDDDKVEDKGEDKVEDKGEDKDTGEVFSKQWQGGVALAGNMMLPK